ncbi:uncharacterized protein LOC144113888 [Amblyomma americanum]
MSVHYKLCWHEEIVYKFKLEWPPDSADILHHEQGIIESIVQMSREGQCPSSLSTAEFAVNIQLSEWKLSGLIFFEKDGVTYEPYHHQFLLRIQKKHVDLPPTAQVTPSVSSSEGLSTDSSLPTPLEQEPPLSDEARRKIGLPAHNRQKKLSDTRAALRGQSKRDLLRTTPYEVQSSFRQVRPSYSRRKLTISRYNIPDPIYRAILQAVNASEQVQDGTIIILDNTILGDGMGPRAIDQFGRCLAPASTEGSGILHTLKRCISGVLGKISNWIS